MAKIDKLILEYQEKLRDSDSFAEIEKSKRKVQEYKHWLAGVLYGLKLAKNRL